MSQHAIAPLDKSARNASLSDGFTLIELSIVLVIIGLLVGGVLVGKDLIDAAAIRAQVTQIERFNTAVHVFQNKYDGHLPGDMPDPQATSFGFPSRGTGCGAVGRGDGNGIIEGVHYTACMTEGTGLGVYQSEGETVLFWVDLSTAGLINQTFNTANNSNSPGSAITSTSTPNLGAYFPTAAIGGGNYIYVWSGGIVNTSQWGSTIGSNGINYFGISAITQVPITGALMSSSLLTVQQAFAIDTKVDDGLPQSGMVTAMYLYSGTLRWAPAGTGVSPGYVAPGGATTCYDSGNNVSNPMQYSMEQSGGTGMNCALSFQFQ